MISKIVDKICSGRFILTVACAIGFLYSIYAKILQSETIGVILISVFQNYFNRKRIDGNVQ